jgi:4-hydroxy-2-oxoheptanedioate aldolase
MSGLREKWQAGEATLGVWLSMPSTISAEVTSRLGFDYVCVDTQHGAVEYQTAVTMFQAIELCGGLPITRVPWNEPGIIGKMLDAGAQGVIVPMVNNRAEAEAVVRACRYAPEGSRSFGPTVAGMRHADYVEWATASVAVIPMIETTEALGNLDDIMSVPGIDAIYVGPADLSLSLGLKPRNNDGEAAFDEALTAIVAACGRHGIVPGIHASGALAGRRLEQGFRMLTVAGDVLALRSGLKAELDLGRTASTDAVDTASPY